MPELHELQRAFADALTAPASEGIDVGMLAGPAERTRKRLRFYRGNVQANAAKALSSAYPVCKAIAGDAFFEGLANVYASRIPSRTGDLNQYGDGFSALVADFPPAREIPYLADVARLEWAAHRAHYAADVPTFDVTTLSRVPPSRFGELVARLHPACALVESRYPLARLWEIHQPAYEGAFEADFEREGHYALVHRPRFRVEVSALSLAEFTFLSACREARGLDAAVRRAQDADAAFTLDTPLAAWIENRVIVDLTLDSAT